MTPDEAIAIVRQRAAGRTCRDGQTPWIDEVLVEEIERLRQALAGIVAAHDADQAGLASTPELVAAVTKAVAAETYRRSVALLTDPAAAGDVRSRHEALAYAAIGAILKEMRAERGARLEGAIATGRKALAGPS